MGTLLQWMEHKFGGGPGGPKRKNTSLVGRYDWTLGSCADDYECIYDCKRC